MNGGTQLSLFSDEKEQAVSVPEKTVTVPEHQRKARRTHEDWMSNLPIKEERHEEEHPVCEKCGQDPARDAENPDKIESCNIRSAPYPKPMIPHSFCSPELAAHITYEKFAKAVPLYRQEKDLASKGIPILRATMSDWVCTIAVQNAVQSCIRSFPQLRQMGWMPRNT